MNDFIPLEKSIKYADEIIANLEEKLNVKPSPKNPDGEWVDMDLIKSNIVSSVPCYNKSCTYRLTLPFEKICPICGFEDELPPQFDLPSTEEIIKSLPKFGSGGTVEAVKGKPQSNKKNNNKNNNNIPAEFGSGLVQVSKVLTAEKHPSADSLLVCTIQLSDKKDDTRQLCAGLVGHYTPEDLIGKLVCTILNLKPLKLRNVQSAAMILAGDAVVGDKKQVRILTPPKDSAIGDKLFVDGDKSTPPKVLQKKTWEAIVANLKVQKGNATFKGKVLKTSKGNVTVPDLPDGSGIH